MSARLAPGNDAADRDAALKELCEMVKMKPEE
jgi:hypothetical protein